MNPLPERVKRLINICEQAFHFHPSTTNVL